MKHIGAVVLNYNNSDLTERCCRALLDSRLGPPGIDVVVVDNCSSDPDILKLRDTTSHLGVTLIESKSNGGYSAGNNIGISYLLDRHCDFVLIANPDVIIAPGAVEAMAVSLDLDDEALFAGPRIESVDGIVDKRAQIFKSWGYFAILFSKFPLSKIRLFGLDAKYYRTGRDFSVDASVFTLSGCCVMFKSSFFRECGLLDEAYFMYSEEITWGRLAQDCIPGGHGLYLASVTAIHDHPKSARTASPFTVTQRMRSSLIYCEKYLHCSRLQKRLLFGYFRLAYWYLSRSNEAFSDYRDTFLAAHREALYYPEAYK